MGRIYNALRKARIVTGKGALGRRYGRAAPKPKTPKRDRPAKKSAP